VALAGGTELTAADLPDTVTGSQATLRPAEAALAGLPYDEALQRARLAFDRAFLGAALQRNDGNITRAAEAIGLHRQSLQRLLRSAGLRPGND
jgi:DNA-binding NtrC family response regulator